MGKSQGNLNLKVIGTNVMYRVELFDKIGNVKETHETQVSVNAHKDMMDELGLFNLEEVAHNFHAVCVYFLKREQYVEFEELPS